ncbi:MAG: peptidylprolyl isomerase [Planctomycetota bacterium]
MTFAQQPESRPAEAPATRPAPNTLVVASVADKVVAIINDEVITKSEIDTRLANVIATQGIKDNAAIEEARERIRNDLGVQLLLTQAARKLAFDDKQIEEGAKQRIAEEEKRSGGRAALHRNIQAQGKSVAEWEREQKNRVLMQRLLDSEIGYDYRPEKEIVITPAMIRAYYRDHPEVFTTEGPMVQARIILISDAKARSHENAVARANELLKRIKDGADFVELAREFSEHLPEEGGLLGWVENDKRINDATVREYLFSHDVHSVSGVLEIDRGVAIVKIEGKRPAGLRPFRDRETQERIQRELHDVRGNELRFALVRRLRAEAYVWPEDFLAK